MDENNSSVKPDLPQDIFEPTLSKSAELAALEEVEAVLCFQNHMTPCEIRTCYGDIKKVVDALMDYTRLLEIGCERWELTGYQRTLYEFHIDKLRSIALKYQSGIGYDYEATVARCQKQSNQKEKEKDIGGEAF